jgi:hypothetical protein
MAVIVNTASARIAVSDDGAKADCNIRQNTVIFHLTQGFDGDAISGNAFTATGHVTVSGAVGDRTDGVEFGFIQITRANTISINFAGRVPSEGSINVQAHVPPAMQNPVMLDSDTHHSPWTRNAPRFTVVGPAVQGSTGDHPALFVPRKMRNSLKNVDNFLFHVVDEREFWSIFTALDAKGTRTYLAHFHWLVRYDQKFNWRNGEPHKSTPSSSFRMLERNVKGAPTEQAIAGLLKDPVGPQFNDTAKQAITTAMLGPRGSNRSENPGWFVNVPHDFFQ